MMADQQQQQQQSQQQAPPQQPQAASSTQQPSQQQQQQQHPVTPATPQPTPPTQHQLAPQQHQQHQQHQQQQNPATVSSLASSIAMNTMAITMPNNIGIAQQGAVANIRSPLPQVQVIHQAMHSPPYLPQFSYSQQQQLMLQNAAMQAAMQASGMNINPQQLNIANMAVAMQGRPNNNMTTTQGMLTHSPTQVQPGTPMISSPPTSQASYNVQATNANNKTGAILGNGNKMTSQATQQQMQQAQQAQVAQATAMVGKTVMSSQSNPPPLLIGQLGVLPGHIATNQTFGPQSKQGQPLSMAGQAQPQLISTQAPVRFSQAQLVSSTGQIITSQPMLTNQIMQAMAAANLQQGIPIAHQPILSAPNQSPTIITGQGIYLRPANTMQQQGIMGVQAAAINPNMRGNAPQNLQVRPTSAAIPIQKQTTAAQTGKVILPSTSKSATAKIQPSINANSSGTKANIPSLKSPKALGRPKGTGKAASAASMSGSNSSPVTIQTKASALMSKPSTPTSQTAQSVTTHTSKSQSDSELEVGKKTAGGNVTVPLAVKPAKEKREEEGSKENISKTGATSVQEKPRETPTLELKCGQESSMPVAEKQRAIVKPHILTHVIDGFIIQEGPEPFPVQRSSLMTEFIPPKPGQPIEQVPVSPQNNDDVFPTTSPNLCTDFSEGITRGVKKRRNMFKRRGWRGRGGRMSGAGRRTPSHMEDEGDEEPMEEQSSSQSSQESSSTADSPIHIPVLEMEVDRPAAPKTNPARWNVLEVYEFIQSLPGCAPYAEEFRAQEIDGQALMLLKEDHLMTAMNMKLGPALKICARINSLKEECN